MRWKPGAVLPLPPTVTAPGVLQILSWGAVTAAEELLQHCRDGASQAEHKGRAHSSDSWRGECGTRGEVRAVPLLRNELGKVMRAWLETWGKFPQIWIRTSSSQLPLQLWFNKNSFVMLMLHKAPVLHSRAGHEISFISIFYGKGEHSELMYRLWCPWWK